MYLTRPTVQVKLGVVVQLNGWNKPYCSQERIATSETTCRCGQTSPTVGPILGNTSRSDQQEPR